MLRTIIRQGSPNSEQSVYEQQTPKIFESVKHGEQSEQNRTAV